MQIFYFKVSLLFFRIRKIPLRCAKKEAYDNYGEISETVLPNLTQISDCLEEERFNDMQTFWQTDKLTQTFALAELTRIHHKNNSSLLVSYVRVIQVWKSWVKSLPILTLARALESKRRVKCRARSAMLGACCSVCSGAPLTAMYTCPTVSTLVTASNHPNNILYPRDSYVYKSNTHCLIVKKKESKYKITFLKIKMSNVLNSVDEFCEWF